MFLCYNVKRMEVHMTLHFNFVIQTNILHFLPKIHFHIKRFDGDFYVFNITWLLFSFVFASHVLFSDSVSWREVVRTMVNNDNKVMDRLDSIVGEYDKYTDEQFVHKVKYATNGFYGG